MATMANIVVKKADDTTDVTWTAQIGSSGDKTPAVWKNLTVGTMPMERPTFTAASRANGPGTARRLTCHFDWPMVSQDAGGNKVGAGKMVGEASILIPQNQEVTVIAEQVSQFCNLLASALIKQAAQEGYAPRG